MARIRPVIPVRLGARPRGWEGLNHFPSQNPEDQRTEVQGMDVVCPIDLLRAGQKGPVRHTRIAAQPHSGASVANRSTGQL